MKFLLICGGIFTVVAIVLNILAFFLEKTYKNKMIKKAEK